MQRTRSAICLFLTFVLIFCSVATVYAAEVTLDKVKNVILSPDAASVFVSFDEAKNVSGYKVYISEKKSGGYKCVETLKKSTSVMTLIDGLKPNRTYYVKVRAYKTIDGKKIYGKYSTPVQFVTKFASPTYAGSYLSYAQMPYEVTLNVENSNYSHDLNINLNSVFLYNVETKSVVCGLSFQDYATAETLHAGLPLQDYYSSNYVVFAGDDCYFRFKQSNTKLNLHSNLYGIAYLVSYNGYEYLARTESTGTYYTSLNWHSSF